MEALLALKLSYLYTEGVDLTKMPPIIFQVLKDYIIAYNNSIVVATKDKSKFGWPEIEEQPVQFKVTEPVKKENFEELDFLWELMFKAQNEEVR